MLVVKEHPLDFEYAGFRGLKEVAEILLVKQSSGRGQVAFARAATSLPGVDVKAMALISRRIATSAMLDFD